MENNKVMPNQENSQSEILLQELTKDFTQDMSNFLTEMSSLVWAEGKSINEALIVADISNVTKEQILKVVNVIKQVSELHDQETEANFIAD